MTAEKTATAKRIQNCRKFLTLNHSIVNVCHGKVKFISKKVLIFLLHFSDET